MPEAEGLTTPSQIVVATAASMALPPRSRTDAPSAEHAPASDATTPRVPRTDRGRPRQSRATKGSIITFGSAR